MAMRSGLSSRRSTPSSRLRSSRIDALAVRRLAGLQESSQSLARGWGYDCRPQAILTGFAESPTDGRIDLLRTTNPITACGMSYGMAIIILIDRLV
jgi:hypothetical protein